jgi:hypothetical protein
MGEYARADRLDQIQADDPSLSMDQARKIRELEEELAATQKSYRRGKCRFNPLLDQLMRSSSPPAVQLVIVQPGL